MTGKLLSDMTPSELQAHMEHCQSEGQRAYDDGMTSEYHVWRQRYFLARSYLVTPAAIEVGATYGIEEETHLFIVDSLRGVFAYGRVLGEYEERGYPIGVLVPLDFHKS